MQAFVWNDRLLTGFDTVDAQHRRLFDLINQLGTLLVQESPTTGTAIEGIFKELATYAKTHFMDEERLMREAGVPETYFAYHADIHRDFVAQLKAMWLQRSSMSAPAETIHGFLVAWLSAHILGEDQEMARHIHRAKGEPAESGVAGGHGPISVGLLQQATNLLYKELARLNHDLAETNRGLEAMIEERTRSLEEANQQLQDERAELTLLLKKIQDTQSQLLQSEKMASIGQLAAGVAHEINNPIGFVTSNLGTLSRYGSQLLQLAELGAATPEGLVLRREIDFDFLKSDLADLLRETQDGLDRVRTIVANLKDFSRVDQAEWQETDVLLGLESTVNVAWNEIKYKAKIVRELATLPAIRCMPAQINQVFLNLLVNAAQAIQEHGTITLRSNTVAQWVWIEVSDTGCGMDETMQRRMFEPFFTTKPVGAGTGLGLSLAYDIINKHGGSIDVSSAIGQGTTIRVWLPIAGPASTSA